MTMEKRLSIATLPVLWLTTVVGFTADVVFEDHSEARGVADKGVNSTGPAFADYDNDGDLDIYVPT